MQPTMTRMTSLSTYHMPRRTTTTTLIAESVGALLRDAREEKGLVTAEVASRTKIPEKYLVRFEDDAHGELADDIYTKIYLKAYGKFLGFETSALLEHYRRERVRTLTRARVSGGRRIHPNVSVPESQLVVTPRIVQAALLGIVALGVLAYFGVQLTKMITPPTIVLSSPAEGLVTTDRTVAVEGTTESEVALVINGKTISPDESGRFKDSLDLQEGLNVITIVGTKKHSKSMTVTRRIIALPKPEEPAVYGPTVP